MAIGPRGRKITREEGLVFQHVHRSGLPDPDNHGGDGRGEGRTSNS